jgi:hypothetical protein
MTDDNLWPLPLRLNNLDDDPEPDVPAHTHDVVEELCTVERLVAILVKNSSRRVKREIAAALDQQEATQ